MGYKRRQTSVWKEIKAALLQLLHKASQGLKMFPAFRLLHQTVFRNVCMSLGKSGLLKSQMAVV